MRIRINKENVKKVYKIIISVVILIIFLGWILYGLNSKSRALFYISKIIPYPAIMVDWESVPYHVYYNDLETLNNYWEYQRENQNVLLGIPDDTEIRERLVNKLINEKIVRIYARKNLISVDEEEVYLEWERLKNKPGGEEEITQFLNEAYKGWSDTQYIDRVLRPFLLQQKVKAALLTESGDTDESLQEEALEIYVLAIEEGADFAELAKEYSFDAVSGPRGGDLGFFSRGSLEPELDSGIFEMNIGDVSEPIKSSFGYHVVRLDDLLYDENGVATKARASHILVRGFDFDTWLAQQKQKLSIHRLVL
jgi:foldase protein PrsA